MFTRLKFSEYYKNCHKIVDEDPSNGLGALWLGDFTGINL